jgi:transcriptional regulator with XRE-family HTH domain
MAMVSNFKDYIDSKGIKQTFISKKVGINKSTMSRIYKDGAIPYYQNAYRIAKVLGVEMEELWYDDEFINYEN